jgi:hypothetical protein
MLAAPPTPLLRAIAVHPLASSREFARLHQQVTMELRPSLVSGVVDCILSPLPLLLLQLTTIPLSTLSRLLCDSGAGGQQTGNTKRRGCIRPAVEVEVAAP